MRVALDIEAGLLIALRKIAGVASGANVNIRELHVSFAVD
jgi:hypothetical protein